MSTNQDSSADAEDPEESVAARVAADQYAADYEDALYFAARVEADDNAAAAKQERAKLFNRAEELLDTARGVGRAVVAAHVSSRSPAEIGAADESVAGASPDVGVGAATRRMLVTP